MKSTLHRLGLAASAQAYVVTKYTGSDCTGGSQQRNGRHT
jgi:hypothetical protein